MKKLLIFLNVVLLLVGCREQDLVTPPNQYPNVLYIGDSLCENITESLDENGERVASADGIGKTAQEILGLSQDCTPGYGRELMEYPDTLPAGYDMIFLGLVSWDIVRGENWALFEESLRRKIASARANHIPVVCVLPDVHLDWNNDSPHVIFKNIMINNCDDTIDPRDWDVKFSAYDGFHMTGVDHEHFAKALQTYIDVYVN